MDAEKRAKLMRKLEKRVKKVNALMPHVAKTGLRPVLTVRYDEEWVPRISYFYVGSKRTTNDKQE